MKRKCMYKLRTLEEIKENPEIHSLTEIISFAVSSSREFEEVITDPDIQIAANYSKGFSRIIKNAEALRKKLKGPYLKTGKEIDSFFKELIREVESERERIGGLKD